VSAVKAECQRIKRRSRKASAASVCATASARPVGHAKIAELQYSHAEIGADCGSGFVGCG
jgi:hypothetical protein